MNPNQIGDLRKTLLSIMDEVHRVCEENSIKYYIIAGTALGARRHAGFIPWDTDIDIAMERNEYERFLEIFNKRASKVFFCAHYNNTANWYLPHALVLNTETMIHWNRELYKSKANIPVYVDVFPLDYCPSNENKKAQQAKAIKWLKKLQSRRECIIYQRNNPWQILLKKLICWMLHVQSNQVFNRILDNAMKRYSDHPKEQICSMACRYSYEKQCMQSEIYGQPTLYEFEGRQYYGPEKISRYLEKLYGDYMVLPPENERTEYMDYIGSIDFKID